MYEFPGDESLVAMKSKSVMTADDGGRIDWVENKATLSNYTNDNVFRLLNYAGTLVGLKPRGWGQGASVCNDELDRKNTKSNCTNDKVFRLLNYALYVTKFWTLIAAYISNYIHFKARNKFSIHSQTTTVWEWIINVILNFTGNVITFPCRDHS